MGFFHKAGNFLLLIFWQVIYNRETDRSRGFGFITMNTVEEAEKAVEMMNGYVSLLHFHFDVWTCLLLILLFLFTYL